MARMASFAIFLAAYAAVAFLASIRIINKNQEHLKILGKFETESPVTDRRKKADDSSSITTIPFADNSSATPRQFLHRRFPTYGSKAYEQQCGWTKYNGNTGNCTFLARPPPGANEGISHWIAQIVTGHILAQQGGCRLLFDYGLDVSLADIFAHLPGSQNWTVPTGFNCQKDPRCFLIKSTFKGQVRMEKIAETLGRNTSLVEVPFYRFAYYPAPSLQLHHDEFRELKRVLPGFEAESGMACSLASLFHLNSRSSQFEPSLFTKILPTLNNRDSLVMSLYIRTGRTDEVAASEKTNGFATLEDRTKYRKLAKDIVNCTMQQERWLLDSGSVSYDRVVWMVVTDSQHLKTWIKESYTSAQLYGQNVAREVVTTQSRGAHTRTQRKPSTADFAEALIDWYLIGESDLVITDRKSPSFGGTAALRTARQLYDASDGACIKALSIHDRDGTPRP